MYYAIRSGTLQILFGPEGQFLPLISGPGLNFTSIIKSLLISLHPNTSGEGARHGSESIRATAGTGVANVVSGREQRVIWRSVASVLAAREERRAATEEIRLLHQRKADAIVRLQGEKLRCPSLANHILDNNDVTYLVANHLLRDDIYSFENAIISYL